MDHLVYGASIRGGQLVSSSVSNPLPTQVISTWAPRPFEFSNTATKHLPDVLDVPRTRLDAVLAEEVAAAEAEARGDVSVEVTVTFKETWILPRFPSLRDQPRDSAENVEVVARNAALVKLVEEARAGEHANHAAELAEQYGATVKETFWLTNAMTIELPLSQVRALEQHPDVQFIERTEKPDAAPAATMLDVRTKLNSDSLFILSGGYIGLLDTGIRRTHSMLKECTANRTTGCWDIALDCFNGTSGACTAGANARDPEDRCDHGTGSAGELIGASTNNAERGMTAAVLDSMKVYSGICSFNVDAGVRGFQAAASWGDNVIVAEIQDRTGGATGAISTAANGAFDANRLVVAAAGNYGPNAGSVAAPGSATKVLAVGALDADRQTLYEKSGRGPTSDGRTKPDLLGLTNITVPSSTSDRAMRDFGGTSAATPNVAGLATLVWNFLNRPAPGIVYASMFAIGNNQLGAQDNDYGAGLPRWPGTADLIASSVSVSSATVEVTINVTTPWNQVNVAIWWPEGMGHKNINLEVVTPAGAVAGSSNASGSVFEKVTIVSPIATGNWKIRLVNPPGSTTSRTVYYAWFPQKW